MTDCKCECHGELSRMEKCSMCAQHHVLSLQNLQTVLSGHLHELGSYFTDPKITLVIRAEDIPGGDAELVITNDDYELAKKAIEATQVREGGSLPPMYGQNSLPPLFTAPSAKLAKVDLTPGAIVMMPNGQAITPVSLEIELVTWDIETTGFKAPGCKILEIGALIEYKDGRKVAWHRMLQNNCDIPENITELTGITKEMIDSQGEDPRKVIIEFLDILHDAKKNVTHNGVRFDIPFLFDYAPSVVPEYDEEFLAKEKRLIESKTFDTAVHFKAMKANMQQAPHDEYIIFAKRVMNYPVKGLKFNLALCGEELGIDVSDLQAHRAGDDVELTRRIYEKITNPDDLPF